MVARSRAQSRSEGRLRFDADGWRLLEERLRAANRDTPEFDAQYRRLTELLTRLLENLQQSFGDRIEAVIAIGPWAQEGIDLRGLPYDDVGVDIVLRSDEKPYSLYEEIAERAFANLDDDDVVIQFRLTGHAEWEHACRFRATMPERAPRDLPLLVRE